MSKDQDFYTQVYAAFVMSSKSNIETLDKDSDLYQKAKLFETLFTDMVYLLKTKHPNERIRSLGEAIWDVFHHGHVRMVLGPKVKSLSFAAVGRQGSGGNLNVVDALVFAPHHWMEMIQENLTMQVGAVIMVGSQAVDFYNGKFQTDYANVPRRSDAYEAESLRNLGSEFTPNEYQARLLRDNPVFDESLEYVRKAVEPKEYLRA